MNSPLALIIDDEPDIRELLEITLERMAINTVSAANLSEALAALSQQRYDLCLTDMRLPDGDGIDIVRHINQHYPQLPVAMITAHGNMDLAIEALKAGAFDFVVKPLQLPVLRQLVETALKVNQAPAGQVGKTGKSPSNTQPLLGDSAAMTQVRTLINKLARSQAPVFITGESGTGKELAARLIHQNGPRAEGPFVAVNCGAIPSELIESELFGHLKGSFSGATRNHAGLFQSAHQGTLFLDEVGDLPLAMQVKLLRAIQEKSVRPVGGTEEIPVDVRIISASHQDVSSMVADGSFRQDLYYRIHVIALAMPTLRERPSDIPALIEYLLGNICEQQGHAPPQISSSARERLLAHPFPGNVRELENILERACALCENQQIEVDDLGLAAAPGVLAEAHGDKQTTSAEQGLEGQLADIERQTIEQALQANRWNRTATAKQLGLTLRALRYRMEKLGLDQKEA